MIFSRFKSDTSGTVTVETAFLLTIMIAVTGGLVEAGTAFFQWNNVQQAARHGARLASISDPIAEDLTELTGLGDGVAAGDPMPSYERHCDGNTSNCSSGSFDSTAFTNIFYGPDGDRACAQTTRERRGMCDMSTQIETDNVQVSYIGSGLGRAGTPAELRPLVRVTITNVEFDFIFLNSFLPSPLTKMPDVHASLMGEDLTSRS